VSGRGGPRELLAEAGRIDDAVYGAIAATPTPLLDTSMRRLSQAANHSKLSIAASVVLAVGGGPNGRRAARSGLMSVAATSAVVNLIVKPIGGRQRPDREAEAVPADRQVKMPRSRSFPSGHTAAAVAFASAAGRIVPAAGVPLHCLAALVGYSRIHTGVHYPSDVIGGALIGSVVADVVSAGRWRGRRATRRGADR
jgi:membrane-associated phospholipid phosphatase